MNQAAARKTPYQQTVCEYPQTSKQNNVKPNAPAKPAQEEAKQITPPPNPLTKVFPKPETLISEDLKLLLERVQSLPLEQQQQYVSESKKLLEATEQGIAAKVYVLPSQEDLDPDITRDNVPLPDPLVLSKDWKTHPLTKHLKNDVERFLFVWKTAIDAGISREAIQAIDSKAIYKVRNYCGTKNSKFNAPDILPSAREGKATNPTNPKRKLYLDNLLDDYDKNLIYQMINNKKYLKSKSERNQIIFVELV
jgi:hypothetical protein